MSFNLNWDPIRVALLKKWFARLKPDTYGMSSEWNRTKLLRKRLCSTSISLTSSMTDNTNHFSSNYVSWETNLISWSRKLGGKPLPCNRFSTISKKNSATPAA